jgi:MYXO-CTERM domain-containing protein
MRFTLSFSASLVALLVALPVPVSAQRTIAYDTLSGESPVTVTCGFCADEKFGVIFRDLPAPAVGLNADDFPIQLEALQLALASADNIGSGGSFTCSGSTATGMASVGIAIYAGEILPSDITALAADDVWPGETLVWSAPDVPIERSVADETGSASYEVNFNQLLLEDDLGLPFRVEAPNVYVRIVVTLHADTALSSASCDSLSLETPSGFAIRDNDGVIANERNFIYADGIGWIWNEEVPGGGIGGDWAMRLEIVAEGTSMEDAGTMPDAGPADTGAPPADTGAADSGMMMEEDGGCSAAGEPSSADPLTLAALVFFLFVATRRSRSL